ncbi:calcium-binding protein, partial [Cribrihabitans sp. XS_ASV171]
MRFFGFDEAWTGATTTRIFNSGTIEGVGNTAIQFYSAYPGDGWSAGMYLENSGEILGAIQIDQAGNRDDTIVNTGLIVGETRLLGGNDTVRNSGEIVGSVDLGFGEDRFENTGLITTTIQAGSNNDVVVNTGTAGVVSLGAGDDVYDGRGGQITGIDGYPGIHVWGGSGNDKFITDDGNLLIDEDVDEGTDTVEASVSFELAANIEELTLLGADDLTGVGNDLSNRLRGNGGANVLDGEGDTDYMFGGAGNDTMRGGEGDDYISANSGWDVIYGEAGNDTILSGAGRDVIDGGEGQDRASYYNAQTAGVFASLTNPNNNTGIAYGDSYHSIEDLWGSEFDDFLYGDENANEITGDRGDDVLWGWDGNDYVNGMWDNDTIAGNKGDDTVRGGLGNDVFQFWSGNGNDTIVDYVDGVDRIQFVTGAANFGALTITQVGADVRIEYGSGDQILLLTET